MTLKEKLQKAFESEKELVVDRTKLESTLGHNPAYLLEIHGITKSDLIRLERKGLAIKARYETRHPKQDLYDNLNKLRQEKNMPPLINKCGTHRVRWIILDEALR